MRCENCGNTNSFGVSEGTEMPYCLLCGTIVHGYRVEEAEEGGGGLVGRGYAQAASARKFETDEQTRGAALKARRIKSVRPANAPLSLLFDFYACVGDVLQELVRSVPLPSEADRAALMGSSKALWFTYMEQGYKKHKPNVRERRYFVDPVTGFIREPTAVRCPVWITIVILYIGLRQMGISYSLWRLVQWSHDGKLHYFEGVGKSAFGRTLLISERLRYSKDVGSGVLFPKFYSVAKMVPEFVRSVQVSVPSLDVLPYDQSANVGSFPLVVVEELCKLLKFPSSIVQRTAHIMQTFYRSQDGTPETEKSGDDSYLWLAAAAVSISDELSSGDWQSLMYRITELEQGVLVDIPYHLLFNGFGSDLWSNRFMSWLSHHYRDRFLLRQHLFSNEKIMANLRPRESAFVRSSEEFLRILGSLRDQSSGLVSRSNASAAPGAALHEQGLAIMVRFLGRWVGPSRISVPMIKRSLATLFGSVEVRGTYEKFAAQIDRFVGSSLDEMKEEEEAEIDGLRSKKKKKKRRICEDGGLVESDDEDGAVLRSIEVHEMDESEEDDSMDENNVWSENDRDGDEGEAVAGSNRGEAEDGVEEERAETSNPIAVAQHGDLDVLASQSDLPHEYDDMSIVSFPSAVRSSDIVAMDDHISISFTDASLVKPESDPLSAPHTSQPSTAPRDGSSEPKDLTVSDVRIAVSAVKPVPQTADSALKREKDGDDGNDAAREKKKRRKSSSGRHERRSHGDKSKSRSKSSSKVRSSSDSQGHDDKDDARREVKVKSERSRSRSRSKSRDRSRSKSRSKSRERPQSEAGGSKHHRSSKSHSHGSSESQSHGTVKTESEGSSRSKSYETADSTISASAETAVASIVKEERSHGRSSREKKHGKSRRSHSEERTHGERERKRSKSRDGGREKERDGEKRKHHRSKSKKRSRSRSRTRTPDS